jgi:hypothetical protein
MKTMEKLMNAIDKSVKTIEHINKSRGKSWKPPKNDEHETHVKINEHHEITHIHEHHGNVDENRWEIWWTL